MVDLVLPRFKRFYKPIATDSIIYFSVLFIPLVIAFVHGIDRPFQQEPDAGITWVYQTILVTDGLQQTSVDHTAYIHFLIMGSWYLLLDLFGFVSTSSLSGVLQAPEPRAAFIELIVASRVFSGLFVGVMGVIFFAGLKSLTNSRLVAAVATLFLVMTTGFVEQAIRIHTELFSALFTYGALFLVIAASRTLDGKGFIWLGFAATSGILALLAKLQVLPLLLALPLVASVFGVRPQLPMADPVVRTSCAIIIAISAWCLAISTVPAAMLMGQLAALDAPPAVLDPKVFQAVVIVYLMVSVGLYCFVFRPHWKTVLLGYSAVVAGMSIGIYFLFINHQPELFEVMVNYVDHMNRYAVTALKPDQVSAIESHQDLLGIFQSLGDAFGKAIERSFTLGGTPGNLMAPLYWSLAAGIVWAGLSRNWVLAVRLLLFLSIALGMEVFCRLRSFAPWYYVYVEPWVVVGNALLFSKLVENAAYHNPHRRIPVGLLGFCAVVLLAVPRTIGGAFEERSYRLEESHCDGPYVRAPEIPDLVCFK